MSRNRVENRAHLIYEHLALHMGEGFTLRQLCEDLDIQPGSTTRSAISRARDLATEAGLHFPPAVPQNGHTYKVTKLAADALDPTLHMGRIRAGVAQRENTGVEFMKRERAKLPPDLRPIVTSYIELKDVIDKTQAQIQRSFDDAVIAFVKARREQRGGWDEEGPAA